MIHVLTAHYQTDRWIDIQLRYLTQYLDRPHRVVADFEGVNGDATPRFDVVTNLSAEAGTSIGHHEKLNRLAKVVGDDAAGDDVLMFLDGDAFPIAPIGDLVEERLGRFPLAAVRRDEIFGDLQPHPCFCVTTVGFWRKIGGDWSVGSWRDELGREVEDVGGKLLRILSERGIEWSPLLRTNRHSFHPVLFAVYEHRVYHHGAGFRPVFVRTDLPDSGRVPLLPSWLPPDPPASKVGWLGWKLRAKLWYELEKRPLVSRKRRATRMNRKVSERVFEWIREDPAFHRRL
jgi:hypothetical protein